MTLANQVFCATTPADLDMTALTVQKAITDGVWFFCHIYCDWWKSLDMVDFVHIFAHKHTVVTHTGWLIFGLVATIDYARGLRLGIF